MRHLRRLGQEALTNVRKYPPAAEVQLTVAAVAKGPSPHGPSRTAARRPGELPAGGFGLVLLRGIVDLYRLKPTDLLFPGEKGRMPAGSVFRRVRRKARAEMLPPHDCKSPAGKRVYDCCHTCLTGG